MLDVYLSGNFDNEVFVTYNSHLETAINGLEREQNSLSSQIEQDKLSNKQIQDINEFAEMIRADVELIADDFEARRKIVNLLDIQIKLTVEDNQKVVYISCRLSQGRLSIMSQKRSFLQ